MFDFNADFSLHVLINRHVVKVVGSLLRFWLFVRICQLHYQMLNYNKESTYLIKK